MKTKKIDSFAGLSLDVPLIMGIVNVTPDSFSDGGKYNSKDAAVVHALKLLEDGADILDIGGESTRPGATPVSIEEELNRTVPIIEEIIRRRPEAVISIDTRHSEVMDAAVKAGAKIINDVSALEGENSLATAANLQVPVIIMHMRGNPQTMQDNPDYVSVSKEILKYLQSRINTCEKAGIDKSMICVDPGIGFGKKLPHNLEILAETAMLKTLGCPLLIGASRKTFIGIISAEDNPAARLGGSIAAALFAADKGADILRVHDVKETYQALKVWQGIKDYKS